MNIDEIITNIEMTNQNLKAKKASRPIASAFEKACDEFYAKLNAIDSFTGKKQIDLGADWTGTHPIGFIFCGTPHAWRGKWIRVYKGLANILNERNTLLFSKLPECNEFISARGRAYITRDRVSHSYEQITKDVFFETNLSSEIIRENIIRLLKIYEIE